MQQEVNRNSVTRAINPDVGISSFKTKSMQSYTTANERVLEMHHTTALNKLALPTGWRDAACFWPYGVRVFMWRRVSMFQKHSHMRTVIKEGPVVPAVVYAVSLLLTSTPSVIQQHHTLINIHYKLINIHEHNRMWQRWWVLRERRSNGTCPVSPAVITHTLINTH